MSRTLHAAHTGDPSQHSSRAAMLHDDATALADELAHVLRPFSAGEKQ